jgi:predicted dehydrogenase
MEPLRWGIVSTADIGTAKVVPGMIKQCRHGRVVGIASRDLARAEEAARKLGIPKAYGSYEELLADPGIEAVYNPLPNHLHVPVSIQALEAGKHVLCEKPIALDAAEAEELLAARDRTGKLVVEAFMVRHHPQWQRSRELVRSGRIGDLRAVHALFGYHRLDPADVRNQRDIGGGGLYDIGCYAVLSGRYLFGSEPRRVVAQIERDPDLGIDRLSSALLDYPQGQASFVCATQVAPVQRVQAVGTKGRIEIEIPLNAPPDRACRIFLDDGSALGGLNAETITFEACDQYALQADAFARCIREGVPPEFPLEDAVANMRVLDALFRSGEEGRWVEVA